MTEEEHFRKYYPDFCYGDRPLSPYWDLFQYGVEFGEQQSEQKIEELKHNKKTVAHLAGCLEEKMKERIEELEMENAELRNNGFTVSAMTEQQLKVALKKGEQLEKENQELKVQYAKECEDVCYVVTNYNKQLTKAKELLTKWVELFKPKGDNIPPPPIQVETEQFLKEIEK